MLPTLVPEVTAEIDVPLTRGESAEEVILTLTPLPDLPLQSQLDAEIETIMGAGSEDDEIMGDLHLDLSGVTIILQVTWRYSVANGWQVVDIQQGSAESATEETGEENTSPETNASVESNPPSDDMAETTEEVTSGSEATEPVSKPPVLGPVSTPIPTLESSTPIPTAIPASPIVNTATPVVPTATP